MSTANTPPVEVFLVDDDTSVTDALKWLLESVKIASCSFDDANAFLSAVRTARGPVCAILDLRMPGMSGLELQQRMADEGLAVPLLFLSAHGDVPAAVSAMQLGATDFLQKPVNPQTFLHSVNRIARLAREHFEDLQRYKEVKQQLDRLSTRELEVLDGLLDGKTSKVLARDLGISPKTVDTHRMNVMRKLQISSHAELVKLVGRMQSGRGR